MYIMNSFIIIHKNLIIQSDLLGLSHTVISRVSYEWSEKE